MLNHEFPPVGGGASPVAFELCSHLAKKGHKVDVVTMHYKDTPRFETVNGFNIYRTPALRAKPDVCYFHELATYVPGAIFKTLSLCRKNNYDIIHCHFIIPGSPLALMVSKITKIPFIITCHGSDIPGYNPDRFKLIHKFIQPAWRFLVKRAPLLTSPSNFLKELILSHYQKANIEVVPNAIDTTAFDDTVEKEKSILLCSRILQRKGFQYVIEALKDTELDWTVNVIGDGPYLPKLKKIAENSRTPIKFYGWLDKKNNDFYELYNKSSIFVFPSSAENFPVALIEAMSAGCAVIASDIPPHKEILAENGIFVKPQNSEQIKNKLLHLINSEQDRRNLGRANKQRVKEFDWETVTEKYIECYKAVKANSNQAKE